LDAKIKKRALLQYEENERLRRRKSEILMRPFNSQELIEYCQSFFIERFNKEFVIDEENRVVVNHLAKYFSNDTDFNKGEFSLQKGIMIMGNVGTGKSWLMAFFQKNKKRCFTIQSCNQISDDYLIYKEDTERIYSTPIEKPLHDTAVFFQKHIGYCFDDLGTEQLKNSFGNKKDVMADILFSVYNKKDYTKFHVTTNLNKQDLEERYGSRLFSRFNEMFNIFIYDGKDRRK
jgi:DNA replication protein DnaC